jgi:hypothetical protein
VSVSLSLSVSMSVSVSVSVSVSLSVSMSVSVSDVPLLLLLSPEQPENRLHPTAMKNRNRHIIIRKLLLRKFEKILSLLFPETAMQGQRNLAADFPLAVKIFNSGQNTSTNPTTDRV